jgi:hypothetical protein
MWLLLAIGMIAQIGCGPTITEGEVYERQFYPQHDIEVDDTIYIDTGNGMSVPIVSSHTETIPDQWVIRFRKIDEQSKRWITRQVTVDRATYDKYAEGGYFSLNPQK